MLPVVQGWHVLNYSTVRTDRHRFTTLPASLGCKASQSCNHRSHSSRSILESELDKTNNQLTNYMSRFSSKLPHYTPKRSTYYPISTLHFQDAIRLRDAAKDIPIIQGGDELLRPGISSHTYTHLPTHTHTHTHTHTPHHTHIHTNIHPPIEAEADTERQK